MLVVEVALPIPAVQGTTRIRCSPDPHVQGQALNVRRTESGDTAARYAAAPAARARRASKRAICPPLVMRCSAPV